MSGNQAFLYTATLGACIAVTLAMIGMSRLNKEASLAVIDSPSIARVFLSKTYLSETSLNTCLNQSVHDYAKSHNLILIPKSAVIAGNASDVSLQIMANMENHCG